MERIDTLTRSKNMAAIRSKGNRSTELAMVSLLRQHKFHGWRRHLDLFGKPDFAWRRERLALFVDGCFWHGCPRCRQAPVNNAQYWQSKFERNSRRDREVSLELRRCGWSILRIWECEIGHANTVNRIRRSLKKGESSFMSENGDVQLA